jgi:Spy/CpxP family protein refolding chaperone
MRIKEILGGLAAALALTLPAAAAGPPAPTPVTHEELGRAFDELAGQIHGLGEQFRRHFAPGDAPAEGPLISIMLEHRQELGLSAAQGQELERIRTDFQRKAIQLDADQRVAQTDLSALLRSDSVDLDKVESKIREIERLRADLRIGRIRAIEQGKGQLTPAQRAKLQTLLAEPRWPWPGAGGRPAPPPRRF